MDSDAVTGEGLKVAIGFPSAVLLVMGGIVGVGIFVNPAVVAQSLHSPALALTAWIVGGVMAVMGAFVYAELAARMPATGGEYVYLRETYGPLVGFLFGWTTLLVVQAGGMAAVAIVFARNLDVLMGGGLFEPAVVVAVLAILALINCLGVQAGDGVQAALGALKFGAIAALIVAGLFIAPHASVAAAATRTTPETNLVKSFGAALIPVVFSYGGWQTANYVAGEMKEGQRNLSRALLVGVLTVVALYLLVNIACLRTLGINGLGRDLTPAADVLGIVAGPLGGKLAAAAVALSALGFVSQSMLTGPRVYFAMARDGLFFRQAARIGAGSRAPVVAIILQAIWTGVLALSGSYDQILSYVTAMNFLFFGISASCVFVLRRRDRAGVATQAGFRAPLFPWTVGLFILICALVVIASFWTNPINSLVGYALMALGIGPYLYWRRANRDLITPGGAA
jgi:APA family basic amino acid/polyamine antiporter